jgi:glycine C-acetyltransferase/8-amino-7-oxononanoate synthase
MAQAIALWQGLLEAGPYVNTARPPATPAGMFILWCSSCAEHSDAQVEEVLDIFQASGREARISA